MWYILLFLTAVGTYHITGAANITCTRRHEVYDCGSACQIECNTLGDVCPIVNIKCNDACYCVKGYARNCFGVCIKERRCPPKGSCRL